MEKTPLLLRNPSSHPPFLGANQPPPPYGVIEVNRYEYQEKLQQQPKPQARQPSGIASVPFVAIIALGIAFFLLFGVTLITPEENAQLRNVLKQSGGSENSSPPSSDHVDIDTQQGLLRGFKRKSRQGRSYTAFYEVPYAEPPINALRFKDPLPPKIPTWSGLREKSIVAPQCIQKEKYADTVLTAGLEDCLYANLYIPADISSSSSLKDLSLPVMVYIHGGGFTDGNGSRYGAEYFMDEDVILITFQFRLGPFGFLNTNDDVIHGNMGFKDQVQMLKWVQDNIASFGGNKDCVTIFGNSGGGISVSFLMISPMARGLFHRAIVQSGANVCAPVMGTMLVVDPMSTVHEVGSALNCSTTDTTKFLECLGTKDANEIALVRSSTTMYSLSIENRKDDQVFMPDTPYNVLKSNPNPVPCIIGVVNSEWVGQGIDLVTNTELVKDLNNDFANGGQDVLGVDMSPEELRSVKTLYFGDRDIGNDTLREAINLSSDRGLIHCSYTSAHMHSKFSPAYLYYISKPPAKSYAEKIVPGFPAKELGMVSHADELQYFFLYDGYPEIAEGDPEYFQFSAYVVKLWATFATTGTPDLNNIEWKSVDSSSNSTFWFELNDNPGKTEVIRDRMNFWDQFTHKQLKYV